MAMVLLGVSRATLYRLLKEDPGFPETLRLGRPRWRRSDLERYMQGRLALEVFLRNTPGSRKLARDEQLARAVEYWGALRDDAEGHGPAKGAAIFAQFVDELGKQQGGAA